MNDHDQLLQEAFETIRADAPGEQPDWLDVVRRAHSLPATQQSSRRRRPRPLLMVAVVAILAGVLALPPIGLGSRLVDLVQPGQATSVRHEFAFMNRNSLGVAHGAMVSKTRRVVTITQYGRPLSLWVAPTTRGGACSLVRAKTGSAGGCLGPEQYRRGLSVSLMGLGGPTPGGGSSGTLGPTPGLSASSAVLSGHVGTNAARAELRYADGTRSVLSLSGGWFLFAVPLAHLRAGHRPVSLVSLDAAGEVLHREAQIFAPHVRYVPVVPAAGTTRTLETFTIAKGIHAALVTGRAKNGNSCLAVLINGTSRHFPMWECGRMVGRRVLRQFGPEGVIKNSLLHWEPAAGGDPPSALPIASGWAAPPITYLRVRYSDGTTTPVALHGRLFLYLVPAGDRTVGARAAPVRLEGLDVNHKLVQALRIDKRRCARGVKWTCRFPS
jgi:hypothetical protein